MAAYRKYWWLVCSLGGSAVVALLGVAIYLEPNSGDLTRLGGYPENWFGWNGFQERIEEQLYSEGVYDRYYDVVVFGDSFSCRGTGEQTDRRTYWQNYLARDTGLSVIAFDLRATDFRGVLADPAYRSRPPRVFVFENVERDMVYIPWSTGFEGYAGPCEVEPGGSPTPLACHPLAMGVELIDRSEIWAMGGQNSAIARLNQAGNVLKKRLSQDVLGMDEGEVVRLPLGRRELFSNAADDQLLVYKKDFLKGQWDERRMHDLVCKLIGLQNLVESNGDTFFVLLIAPDRLTVYRPYVRDNQWLPEGKIPQLDGYGLHLVRADRALGRAIEEGVRDIYLPNDTHLGARGHNIVARETLRMLVEYDVIRTMRARQQ